MGIFLSMFLGKALTHSHSILLITLINYCYQTPRLYSVFALEGGLEQMLQLNKAITWVDLFVSNILVFHSDENSAAKHQVSGLSLSVHVLPAVETEHRF